MATSVDDDHTLRPSHNFHWGVQRYRDVKPPFVDELKFFLLLGSRYVIDSGNVKIGRANLHCYCYLLSRCRNEEEQLSNAYEHASDNGGARG